MFIPTTHLTNTGVPGPQGPAGADGGLPVVNLANYVGDFTGSSDQAAEVADAIADLPSTGGIVYHPGGKVKISSVIDLSTTYVRFEGPLAGLDNNVSVGAWFYTGTASQTLFSCKPVSSLPRQTGVQFQSIGMLDTVGGCTLLDTKDTNRLRLDDVLFSGFGSAGSHTTTGLVLDVTPAVGSDSAYHHFEDCNFRSCLTGLKVIRTNGFTMNGGLFSASYECIGADIQTGANMFFTNVSGSGCFPCWNVDPNAGHVHWANCYWETTANDQPYRGWYISGDESGQSGYGCTLVGCHATGNGSNSSGFYFDTGSHKTLALVRAVNCGAGGVTDNSNDNDIFFQGPGWVTPIRLVESAGPTFAVSDTGPIFTTFSGTPESNVTARVGSICTDYTNGVMYVKKTGTGSTGWKLVTQAA